MVAIHDERGRDVTSVNDPSCVMRPSSSTMTRSASDAASRGSCVTRSRTPENSARCSRSARRSSSAAGRVDGGKRLVEQQHLRVGDEHARERGAL